MIARLRCNATAGPKPRQGPWAIKKGPHGIYGNVVETSRFWFLIGRGHPSEGDLTYFCQEYGCALRRLRPKARIGHNAMIDRDTVAAGGRHDEAEEVHAAEEVRHAEGRQAEGGAGEGVRAHGRRPWRPIRGRSPNARRRRVGWRSGRRGPPRTSRAHSGVILRQLAELRVRPMVIERSC